MMQSVYYHGTASDFTEFDANKMMGGNLGNGVYLTDDKKAAEYYSMSATHRKQLSEMKKDDFDYPKQKLGIVKMVQISKVNVKILDHLPTLKDVAIIKEQGFDGISYPDETFKTTEDWNFEVLGNEYPHDSIATLLFDVSKVSVVQSTM